jgi:hypothetical protein
MGIVQEVRPMSRHKEVHLLYVDVPYKIAEIDTVHLANATVKIPVITFILLGYEQHPERILQISGIDFISLNSRPVHTKESKQITIKLRDIIYKAHKTNSYITRRNNET